MAIIYNPNKTDIYPAYSAYNLSDAGGSSLGYPAAPILRRENRRFHGLSFNRMQTTGFPEILMQLA